VKRRLPQGQVLTSSLKCFAVLDALAAAPEPLSLGELANITGTLRGTVHKQVRTLVTAGWAEQGTDRRYRLSLRAVEVAAAVLEQADLGSRVLPILAELAARTGETSAISVLRYESALILQRVETNQALRVDIIAVGTRMPLRTSASGRVLVAFAPPDDVERLRRGNVELPSDEMLAAARRDGYALSIDEYLVGMASIAVPLSTKKLGMVALSTTAPTTRFYLDTLLKPLLLAEAEITEIISG
jgi:DNA-binding IclR family transcriptional regulator